MASVSKLLTGSVPRILVVDDQFARNAAEQFVFLKDAGLSKGKLAAGGTVTPYAEIVFCPGHREEGDQLVNDYAVVRDAIGKASWALVLLDMQFDSGALDADGHPAGQAGDDAFGMALQQRIKAEFPGLPLVMLTGKRQEEIGESGIPYLSKHKLGAYDLRRALLRYGNVSPSEGRILLGLKDDIRADDSATFSAFRLAFIHASSDVSVLILGESGTGKEVLAQYVHDVSNRAAGPFVAVNVAAIPANLVESELFGHVRGAFTGAQAMRRGRFEQAKGGTLFLDEIGDMPTDTQAKVLRAIQERKITRVGDAEAIAVDIRLVCATSRDLAARVKSGEFRGDLLHRINTLPITMPPLRERQADIIPLARRFLEKFSRKQERSGVSVSTDALAVLESQRFPGNVRELENLIERLVSAAGHHQIIGRTEVLEALGPTETPLLDDESLRGVAAPKPVLPISDPVTRMPDLEELTDWLDRVEVDKDDSALKGIKPKLDAAVQRLCQRLAGAALERCRDPNDQSLNRQSAMRLVMGDANLKGKGPARVVNEILGRGQEQTVTEEDLEQLVALWREGKRNS